jgi:glycosyltransferase involved in cell wall biosynthesis
MRVLMISKALVVGAYQKKCEELARLPGMDLHVAVPPSWQEPGGRRLDLERAFTQGYELAVEPIALNSHFHLHFYPMLHERVRALRPDIVHIDEEPYNLATHQALSLGRSVGARCLFFTWQNLYRRYPWPWRSVESYVLARADYAEAVDVLRRKDYRGPAAVIPQFGVDPSVYRPLDREGREGGAASAGPFTIGYLGRLVEEKGLLVLLHALAELGGEWRLEVVGSGPLQSRMVAVAHELGIRQRVFFGAGVPSAQVPELLNTWDCLVLPSLTRTNWKEQFGRVLVEAMACQAPVVGSDSGEIPHLVGDAGLIVPEGSVGALAGALRRLRDDPVLRASLGMAGRARVLARYTQQKIAEETYGVYRAMMEQAERGQQSPAGLDK